MRTVKGCTPTPSAAGGRRPAAALSGRGRRGRAGRRKAGETAAPGPVGTRPGRWGGRAGRRRPSRETRGPAALPPPRDPGTFPGASGPHLPPALPPPLSVNSLPPAGLTASAARRLSPPSRNTTSFLLFLPAPPASPPRLRRYRSPWRGGCSAQVPPLPTPRQASERTGGGRGQTSSAH